jgi:hypothetical protein
MRGGRVPWLAVIGLAVQAALLLDGFASVPVAGRLALALFALVLVPGYAVLALGTGPPGGPLLAPAWAFGLGVAWNGALVMATIALGLPFTVWVAGSLASTAALWAVGSWRGRARGESATADAAWSARTRLWLVLAAALGIWQALTFGTSMTYDSDSPDHVGTIRRMLASGDPFPNDAYFRDAGVAGADPRKGLWHSQVALIARLADADPLDAWRWLSAALAPLFVLNAATLGFLIRGPAGAAVAGWALVLTYGGSLASESVRQSVFSTRVADQLTLATAVALIADVARPARAHRLAAVGLALGAVAAHVVAAIHLAIGLGAFVLALAIRDRGLGARLRRAFGTALLVGLAMAPYLAWRTVQSYAPRSAIHTEPQGLLWVSERLRVVNMGVLWDWFGWLWVLFPLAWPALWRAGRERPAALYVFAASVAVPLLIFNPVAVALLQPRLGYLLMRMVWLAPLVGVLAFALPGLWTGLRAPAGAPRLRAALGLAAILALGFWHLSDAAEVLVQPRRFGAAEQRRDPARWADALRWMDRHLPPGTIVLSDPTTSYSIPMYTRHYVATLVDQHSSPNDPDALRRLLDARDALDPFGAWPRTRDVIRHYDVTAVALNDRFAEPPQQTYWAATPGWTAAARARLDRHPDVFQRAFDRDGFVVYRVDRDALERLREDPPPRPSVQPYVRGRLPIARRMGESLPVLHSVRLTPRVLAPGDTMVGVARWRAVGPLEPGSYWVSLRFDRPLPAGFDPPRWLGKPARKLIETLRSERYRFRSDHLPAGGGYGVDLWRPDEVLVDSFAVVVPRDVAEGDYTVRIKMLNQPVYPNYRLSDYFFDEDYYAGLPIAAVRIARDRDAGARGRPPAGATGGH